MTFGVISALAVSVVKNAHEAVKAGFFYRKPVYLPIHVERVVVVQDGMENGLPTVDFVLVDEKGQKYTFMITGKLLRSIPLGDKL